LDGRITGGSPFQTKPQSHGVDILANSTALRGRASASPSSKPGLPMWSFSRLPWSGQRIAGSTRFELAHFCFSSVSSEILTYFHYRATLPLPGMIRNSGPYFD